MRVANKLSELESALALWGSDDFADAIHTYLVSWFNWSSYKEFGELDPDSFEIDSITGTQETEREYHIVFLIAFDRISPTFCADMSNRKRAVQLVRLAVTKDDPELAYYEILDSEDAPDYY